LNCDFIDIFSCDKIDLTDLKNANPLLCYEIYKNSQLLYGNELDYSNFKARAFCCYIDAIQLFFLQNCLLQKQHKLLKKLIYG